MTKRGDNRSPEQIKAEKAADRLEEVARRTIESAEEKINQPRQMNTARRARMGSGVIEQAQADKAHARTALKIAAALRQGEAGPLANVKSLADIRQLSRMLREAESATDRVEGRRYQPGGRPATHGDLKNIGPLKSFVRVSSGDVEKMRESLKGKKGFARDLQIIESYSDVANRNSNYSTSDSKVIEAVSRVAKAIKSQPKGKRDYRAFSQWEANRLLDEIRDFDRAKKVAGISPAERRAVLSAFLDVKVGKAKPDPIALAEQSLIGRKIPGFFPTPEHLAKRMAELADLQPGQSVLEPSAGTGRLADVVKKMQPGANVSVVESVVDLQNILKQKGHSLVDTDFTAMDVKPSYDRVIMNPPFEKGQDMAHVRRAFDMLKPGGKIVAIMGEGAFFMSDRQATEFRTWLDQSGGTSEKLPEGTFKESNTGVNTRLVTISKPPEAARPSSWNPDRPTPLASDLPEGAFKGSQFDFEKMSPGMRREIQRTAEKLAPEAPVSATSNSHGLADAYERDGRLYGTVLDVPTEVRPGSNGDPFKYKSSFYVSGPVDKDGYSVGQKKIHAATLAEYEAQLRDHLSKNPNWKAAGDNAGWSDAARAASAEARAAPPAETAIGNNRSPSDAIIDAARDRHAAAVDAYDEAMRRGDHTDVRAKEAAMKAAFDDLKETQAKNTKGKLVWDRASLDFKHLEGLSDQELSSFQRQIRDDPASRNPDHLAGKSIRIYNKKAEAKLDRIAQEITGRMAQKRRAGAVATQTAQSAKSPAIESAVERAMKASDAKRATESKSTLARPPVAKAPIKKIEDLGEKIGGARKDLAASSKSKPRASKPRGPALPMWERDFIVMQNMRTGKFNIHEKPKGRSRMAGRALLAEGFDTEAQAEAARPLAAVAKKHHVRADYPTGPDGKTDYKNPTYEIWRKVTDRKQIKVVGQSFATKDDAMAYMAKNAKDIIEIKTSFGEEILAKPEKVLRTGPQVRTGDVKGETFRKAFGFRGVEFGNWNNQVERQQVMNHAHDAMKDLSRVTGISERALALNDDLGLAFGARGQGLSGARAHYEPAKAVINLTKMSGAGSKAHEWWHAFDHVLARTDRPALAKKIMGADGTPEFDVSTSSKPYASEGMAYKSELPTTVQQAMKNLMESMYRKPVQYQEDATRSETWVENGKKELDQKLTGLRQYLEREQQYGKRFVKPATPEQLARFDAAAARIKAGEVNTSWVDDPNSKKKLGGGRHSNPALEELSSVMKEVRGRNGFGTPERPGDLDRLRGTMRMMHDRLTKVDEAQKGVTKTRMVPTDYLINARNIDRGRATDYWSVPREMSARAFSAFVEDQLAGKGQRSDFLSFGSTNDRIDYRMLNVKPFPEGAERARINQQFANLFQEVNKTGILKNNEGWQDAARAASAEARAAVSQPKAPALSAAAEVSPTAPVKMMGIPAERSGATTKVSAEMTSGDPKKGVKGSPAEALDADLMKRLSKSSLKLIEAVPGKDGRSVFKERKVKFVGMSGDDAVLQIGKRMQVQLKPSAFDSILKGGTVATFNERTWIESTPPKPPIEPSKPGLIGFQNESTQAAAQEARAKAESGEVKAPKIGKKAGLRFVGTDRTLERGPVNVFIDKSGNALVGDVNAALDVDGRPMGLRLAPSGTNMAVAKNNADHRFHQSAKNAPADTMSPDFKPVQPKTADLKAEAKAAGIKGYSKMSKATLLDKLGKGANKLGIAAMVAAPATAALVAYDATRNQAMAAGSDKSKANTDALMAGTVAGGATAAMIYAMGKSIQMGIKAAATVAPKIAPALGPVGLGIAAAAMGYGAYDGYQKGGMKGAALGLLGAQDLTLIGKDKTQLTAKQKEQYKKAAAKYETPASTANKANAGWTDEARIAAAMKRGAKTLPYSGAPRT